MLQLPRFFIFACFISLILSLGLSGCSTGSWRNASRESAGIAPKPEQLTESIFQIYTARAFSWRGYFGTHPWVAWKKKDERQYTIAHVTSWGLRRGGHSAISMQEDIPDRHWFGERPNLILTITGEKAERVIEQVKTLIESYPYKDTYRVWPGPNSNTFVDYLIRFTPELTVELPPESIGKDYLTDSFYAYSPSGQGVQVSAYGVLGLTVGLAEGIELNILSMTFGIDFLRPAIKLPFIGRLGMDDKELEEL